MSANILGKRFYNDRKAPAWHGIGMNRGGNISDTPRTAIEALELVGDIKIEKRPLLLGDGNGGGTDSGYYAIMREPIPEDDEWRMLGTPVTEAYEPIQLKAAAALHTSNVVDLSGNPVNIDTLGILGKGERMFIGTKLPSFDVNGDQIDNYLLFDNPLVPGISLGVYTTSVRVVCQNTLNAGIDRAAEMRKISHHEGAEKIIGEWLSGIYERALVTIDVMKEAYEILASTKVSEPQIRWIINETYPLPDKPKLSGNYRSSIEAREQRYVGNLSRVQRTRRLCHSLYNGEGVGSDRVAAAGTAFGAWNAVAEMETYRRGADDKAAVAMMNGDRANRTRRAFSLAMNVDKFETHSAATLGLKRVRA